MAHTAKDKTKSYSGRSLMVQFTDSNPLQVQKNVRCPIFLLRRREIDWFYFYVPNGRPESKKKPCTTEWTFHMQMSAIIRNSHIYKKRTEMLSLLFMALFIFISFPKGLYNINSIRPWNLKNRKKRHFLRRSLHLADRFSRVVFSNEL